MNHQVSLVFVSSGSETESVRRCLSVLFASRAGEQALDRDFGLTWDFLDQPPPVAQALLAQEILAKAARYEPRARILSVDYDLDAPQGLLRPRVTVEVTEP